MPTDMRLLFLLSILLAAAAPASAQLRRVSVGYLLTGGSDGYAAQEGRLDGSGRVADWLGFYAGGSFISDDVYRRVWSGAAGLEFHVGEEDRLRLGAHLGEGRFEDKTSNLPLENSGVEFGFLTQLVNFHSLGLFYRYTSGTLVPIGGVRASASAGGPLVPGRRETNLRDNLKTRPVFQVNEFTAAGSFDLTGGDKEGIFLDLAVTLSVVSNIEPAVAESAALSFPITGPIYAMVAGTLEQSGTLGSQQFGALGVSYLFGGTK